MTPTISVGSLAIIHRVPESSLKVGNIVTYTNPRNPSETITHRIIKVIPGSPTKLVTKGDHNPVADPTIVTGAVVGRMVWHVPVLGNFIGWLHTVPGVVIVIILPGLLLVLYEIRLMAKRLSEIDKPIEAAHDPPVSPTVEAPKPKPRVHRNMDGVARHLVMVLAVIALVSVAGGKSFALLISNKVSLTDWTFTTAGSSSTTTNCPPGTVSVTIGGTNNNTSNSVKVHTSCTTTITNNGSTTITNNSSQTVTSGNVDINGTATTGTVGSGSSSASSSTSTQVTSAGY
jgi:signal peptidase I